MRCPVCKRVSQNARFKTIIRKNGKCSTCLRGYHIGAIKPKKYRSVGVPFAE